MTAHLIAAENLDMELFARVADLLEAVPGINLFWRNGPGSFRMDEDTIDEEEVPDQNYFEQSRPFPMVYQNLLKKDFPFHRQVFTWADLFSELQKHRQTYKVPDGEFLILLTPVANDKNWFAMLDEKNPYNGFIHTEDWRHYLSCDPAIPIAFEVITLMLQRYIFESENRISTIAHKNPIGCISDLCLYKTEIILKMRTADICQPCLTLLNGRISMPEIHHALAVLESLRVKMLYAQNFRQNCPPSKIVIRPGGRIFLPDYNNIEIRLPTLEKVVYLLFLRHPEGIFLSSMVDFREELIGIYRGIASRGRIEDINRRITELTNRLNEQMSIKISRIKKAFIDTIGESLADYYIIKGANAEKRNIRLERAMVEDLVGR